MEFTLDGVDFNPKVTAFIRNEFFKGSSEIILKNIGYRGKKITVTVKLPENDQNVTGFFVKKGMKLNGNDHTGVILFNTLEADNEVEIELEYSDISGTITKKTCDDEPVCFAPRVPTIPLDPYGVSISGGKLQITFSSPDTGVTFNMYRDGEKVAENVVSPWIDDNSTDYADTSYCYSVTALNSAGNESHIANPVCFWGTTFERVTKIEANGFDQIPNASDHGRDHFADWGLPGAELSASSFTVPSTGIYLVQIEYGSGRPIDTGITSCLKEVEFIDESDSSVVFSGFAVMPHLGADNWDKWGDSSFLKVALNSTKTYKISITDAFNMSYFQHFVPYTGPIGGGEDVYNRANISTLKFLLKEKN